MPPRLKPDVRIKTIAECEPGELVLPWGAPHYALVALSPQPRKWLVILKGGTQPVPHTHKIEDDRETVVAFGSDYIVRLNDLALVELPATSNYSHDGSILVTASTGLLQVRLGHVPDAPTRWYLDLASGRLVDRPPTYSQTARYLDWHITLREPSDMTAARAPLVSFP